MFGRRITLFTVFGIRVGIDLSWIVLALLIAWSLAQGFFPAVHQGLPAATYWWMGLAGVVGLFASLVAHELMHSVVARAFGTPVRGITLFALGGVAEMEEEPGTPGGELLMALAGPIASALLALAFHLVAQIGLLPPPLTVVASYLGAMNALLAAFNMLPAFPLDGGRVLRAILWKWRGNLEAATRTAAGLGDAFGWLLILVGLWHALTDSFAGGLWWMLIGVFVRAAARASLEQMRTRRVLKGQRVARYMSPSPVTVPSDMPVDRLVEDIIYRHHFDLIPVVDHGRLVGSAGTREIRAIPRERWPVATAGEIATPPGPHNTIEAGEEVLRALAVMQSGGSSRLMVTDGGRLVGVIVLKDLLEVLALRLDLEG